jgi:hypothetical protein
MNEPTAIFLPLWIGNNARGTGSCRRKKGTSFMTAQIIQRPNSHPPRYDDIEVLTIGAGVLLIVAIAVVF